MYSNVISYIKILYRPKFYNIQKIYINFISYIKMYFNFISYIYIKFLYQFYIIYKNFIPILYRI